MWKYIAPCLAHTASVSAQNLLLMIWFINVLLFFTHTLFLISKTLWDKKKKLFSTLYKRERETEFIVSQDHISNDRAKSQIQVCAFCSTQSWFFYLVKNRVAALETPSTAQPGLFPCGIWPTYYTLGIAQADCLDTQGGEKAFWNALSESYLSLND